MVKMIMHGCCGAMGHVITGLAAEDGEIRIVAGIDVREGTDLGYPVFPSLDQPFYAAEKGGGLHG